MLCRVSATATLASESARGERLMPSVERINEHLERAWRAQGLTASRPASDGQWCRRVFLDVIGRIPTVDELQGYLALRGPDRRAVLVNKLTGAAYQQDYLRNWTTIWTNRLIGRTGGTKRRSLISRDGLQHYLRMCLVENKPYDQMVYELITATGGTQPGDKDFNGATNFLAMKIGDKAVQATSQTARLFLGIRVECTQCHNHPFNTWKQNQFWELNAFFRQARALRSYDGRDLASVRLIDQDFPGEGGNAGEAEIYYELRNGRVAVAYPTFVDGTSLVEVLGGGRGNSGYVSDVNRRRELAKLVVKSDALERSLVNFMWSYFFGFGFTKPVDDMGPHNPPSHPELLSDLSADFRASGFDLRQLIRWITLSDAYSLSSRSRAGNRDDAPLRGTRPMFSRFYLRQMQPEQLYASLMVATDARGAASLSGGGDGARRQWLRQFASSLDTDDDAETTTFDGTIPQILMMMNGKLVRRATRAAPGRFLYEVAADGSLSRREQIERLYLAALARRPTTREVREANRLLASHGGDITAALEDIWWALLNCNEFILNH